MLWCATLSVQPVTIVDDLLVTTDGQELCQLVHLVLTSRKMLLIVPRLGTDVVTDIVDKLFSVIP